MKRQPYFPSRQADEPEWFVHFAGKITPYATTVGMDAPRTVEIIIAKLNELIKTLRRSRGGE